MGYFAYIAEKSFRISPTGERLFYSGGPWSRPFVITSEAVEDELRKRNLWATRLTLGPIILGLPILAVFNRPYMKAPDVFVGLLAVALLLSIALRKLLLGAVLKKLHRSASGAPVGDFYRSMADKHSLMGLIFGFVVSVAFVALGLWMYDSGVSPIISLFCVGFFGLCSMAWGYGLYWKNRSR